MRNKFLNLRGSYSKPTRLKPMKFTSTLTVGWSPLSRYDSTWHVNWMCESITILDEKLTWHLTVRQTILGAVTSTIAGAIHIPNVNSLVGTLSELSILGSTLVKFWLKRRATD